MSTRRNPSLPRRTAAKTRVIAQPEVKPEPFNPQIAAEGGVPYIPPPPGGWPGGVPPWEASSMPVSIPPPPSYGTTAYRSGGRSPSGGSATVIPTSFKPTIIPPGVAGVKTSTMSAPTPSTYTSAYPMEPPETPARSGHWTDKYFAAGVW